MLIIFFRPFTQLQAADSLVIKNYQALWQKNIDVLDFRNTDIKDVLRAIADKFQLNIFIADEINVRVTVHLNNVSIKKALYFLAEEYELVLKEEGPIIKFELPPPEPEPDPAPLEIEFLNGKLSVDINDEDIDRVIRDIALKSGQNIILSNGLSGNLSGLIQNLPFEEGLKLLLSNNGFEFRKQGNAYIVDWGFHDTSQRSNNKKQRFWIDVHDGLFDMDLQDAEIDQVVQELALRAGIDLIVYSKLPGTITAKCSKISFTDALNYLLKGSNFTFRKQGEIYTVGEKSLQGITSSRLLKLQYLKADGLVEILPKYLLNDASFQIIKEHNGLMVTGPEESIREAEDYLAEIDHPIPQILIEALVVDYNISDLKELTVNAGLGSPESDTSSTSGFRSLFPNIEQSASGDFLNGQIAFYAPQWGLPKVGKLPSDFYIKVKALERESKAKVVSRPQIATLNGHTASISIGTTQYFKFKTQTPYPSINQVYIQESERFEQIKAEMLLEITPWVSASGEITTEIHPEFSTPKENLDPETPPTIDHRILSSTVRLKDGETIILGGLIQDVESKSWEKVPLLGDIPILGNFFKNHSHNNSKTELMIYVTPHLYFEDLQNVDVQGYIK